MAKTLDQKAEQLEQGKNLARRLYDLKIPQLERIDDAQRRAYLAEYPLLGVAEFDDVRRQVIEAKTAERIRIGWHTIPRDVTVLVFVLVAWLVNIPAAIIAGVAVLVLLESIFQVVFDPKLYVRLSWLVWLTYPAYLLFAWVLYRNGQPWYLVIAGVVALWAGTYLAGLLAPLPMQLILRGNQASGSHPAASEKPGRKSP